MLRKTDYELIDGWNAACRMAGFAIPPRVARVERGSPGATPSIVNGRAVHSEPDALVVRMYLGQVISDLEMAAARLAAVLGIWSVVVEPVRVTDPGWVRVRLVSADPLGGSISNIGNGGGLYLGTGANGQPVTLDHLTHMVVAGQTGSGKSIFLYHLLSTLADEAIIAGVDPSGLLFRPLPPDRRQGDPVLRAGIGTSSLSHPGDSWRASGLAQPGRIVETLAALCRELDRRCALIPEDQDSLGPEHPMVLVIFEEYPAVLRALDAADSKAAKQVRLYVSRLLAEARKVRITCVLCAQRPEANIIGGAERAQAPTRITFGCSSPEDVKLLHPEASAQLAETHIGAPPGIALLSRPGRAITRLRTPHVTYSEYARALRQASPGDPGSRGQASSPGRPGEAAA